MIEKKRILILGGNQFNVFSIKEARDAGFFTIVADRNPDAPGLKIADLGWSVDLFDYDKLQLEISKIGGIDGIVSMAEAGVRPMAILSDKLRLPSISIEAAENATSKAKMRLKWQTIPEYSTDFRIVSTLEQTFRSVNELNEFPLIFKPDISFGGSRGVSKIETFEQIEAAFKFAKSNCLFESDVVIEKCINGPEYSCEVLIWKNQIEVLCVGEKVKSLAPYRVDLSVQYPAVFTDSEALSISKMCQAAITTLGITQGIAHVEFAYTKNGPKLFELGARCGGGHTPVIVKHVSGVNEFIEFAKISCGIAPTVIPLSKKKGAEYRFIILEPGEISTIEISDDVIGHEGICDFVIDVKSGDIIQEVKTTCQRSGAVIAFAETKDDAVLLADWACEHIHITYCDGKERTALKLLNS